MTFNDLDLDVVKAAIETDDDTGKLLEGNFFRSALSITYDTLVKYFDKDMSEYDVIGVEDLHTLEFSSFPLIFLKQLIDLELVNKKTGKHRKVDWKSTGQNLDTDWGKRSWRELYKESWQWRTYLAGTECKEFEFRGLSTTQPNSFTELVIRLNEDESVDEMVDNYYSATLAQIEGLAVYDKWPQNFGSCEDYGRRCLYYDDCRKGTERLGLITLDKLTHISYSSVTAFHSCQERKRREWLDSLEVKDGKRFTTDESNLGKAIHRGLAAAYLQAVLRP